MNMCRILFFATFKDRTGIRQDTIDLPLGISVSALKSMVGDRFPSIKPLLPHALIAVNREYARDDTLIPAGAEIAFFPLVSGGNIVDG